MRKMAESINKPGEASFGILVFWWDFGGILVVIWRVGLAFCTVWGGGFHLEA